MKSGVIYPGYGSEATMTQVTGACTANYPLSNLPDLKNIRAIAQASTTGQQVFTFSLTAARTVQALALAHHNAPLGATFQVWLFNDNNPDPATNPGGIVYNSGATVAIWPTDPGTILFPAVRPIVLTASVSCRSGRIQLNSRAALDAVAWELGAIEVGGWWEWKDVQVDRELGLKNTDNVLDLSNSVQQGQSQWAPRTWRGSREIVTQTEVEGTALDFQRERGLTNPFVWLWDYDDSATWARECMVARNNRLIPPVNQNYNASRLTFDFLEHL